MGYDVRYQVKQYVAVVEGDLCAFRVFKTGDERYYLFCQMDDLGCDTGLHVPVARRDLVRECASALLHGRGFSLPAYRRL